MEVFDNANRILEKEIGIKTKDIIGNNLLFPYNKKDSDRYENFFRSKNIQYRKGNDCYILAVEELEKLFSENAQNLNKQELEKIFKIKSFLASELNFPYSRLSLTANNSLVINPANLTESKITTNVLLLKSINYNAIDTYSIEVSLSELSNHLNLSNLPTPATSPITAEKPMIEERLQR